MRLPWSSKRRDFAFWRLLALGLALAGLSPAIAQHGSTALGDFSQWSAGGPQTGLRKGKVAIRTSDGRTHVYKVEFADTANQQATGMMFRKSMAPDSGMLFPMQPARLATFYMRNTYVPLDIIFIGEGGRVLNVGKGEPLNEDIVAADGLTIAVLELKGGEAARIGLKSGDRIQW